MNSLSFFNKLLNKQTDILKLTSSNSFQNFNKYKTTQLIKLINELNEEDLDQQYINSYYKLINNNTNNLNLQQKLEFIIKRNKYKQSCIDRFNYCSRNIRNIRNNLNPFIEMSLITKLGIKYDRALNIIQKFNKLLKLNKITDKKLENILNHYYKCILYIIKKIINNVITSNPTINDDAQIYQLILSNIQQISKKYKNIYKIILININILI